MTIKKMPTYRVKWLKMSTSGRPDKRCQMESIKNCLKASKNAVLIIKMVQNAHFWPPCLLKRAISGHPVFLAILLKSALADAKYETGNF